MPSAASAISVRATAPYPASAARIAPASMSSCSAITTSRLLCYYALDSIDRGGRVNGLSAMAKRHATTACERAISEAMQVHGAMGIGRETGLERLYRDVRMLPIPDGANNILALIQGREIVGMDAFR